MTYTLTVTLNADPATAESRVREALSEEGFGILSEINIQEALESKLGEDIGAYTILGACNPPLAHEAIGLDADIGALLPCNVLIRANPEGGTDVVAADPAAMMALAGDDLKEIAEDAKARLQRALKAIS